MFQLNGFAIDVAKVTECLSQYAQIHVLLLLRAPSVPKDAYARYLLDLLSAPDQRPYDRRSP
jgi:hypothetical protein